MSKTVVGIFKLESDAQDAQNYLLAHGFGDGDVDIKTAHYKNEADGPRADDSEDGLIDRVAAFFKDLFQSDENEAKSYIEAGKKGTIVTVHAKDAEEAAAAARIMDDYGAIDALQNLSNEQPGHAYEDPIVNPPSVSHAQASSTTSVDARGVYQRSRIIDRGVQPQHRLRSLPPSTTDGNGSEAGDTPELNRTVAERDAMLHDIIDNNRKQTP